MASESCHCGASMRVRVRMCLCPQQMCGKKKGPHEPVCPQHSGPASPTWNSVYKRLLKMSVPFGAARLLFPPSSLSLCWPPALSKDHAGIQLCLWWVQTTRIYMNFPIAEFVFIFIFVWSEKYVWCGLLASKSFSPLSFFNVFFFPNSHRVQKKLQLFVCQHYLTEALQSEKWAWLQTSLRASGCQTRWRRGSIFDLSLRTNRISCSLMSFKNIF